MLRDRRLLPAYTQNDYFLELFYNPIIMKQVLLLSFCLTSLSITCQNIMPTPDEQPEWLVHDFLWGIMDDIWYYTYGDIIQICGEEWIEVIGGIYNENNLQLVGYYREEGLEGWMRKEADCEAPSWIIYDFNLEEQDTFLIPYLFYDLNVITSRAIVTGRDTLDTGQIKIKLQDLEVWDRQFFWITGIGAGDDPFRLLSSCYGQTGFECEAFTRVTCLYKNGLPASFINSSLCYLLDNRLFVDKDATLGNQTGRDWENAFTDLQQALAIAEEGHEIWVAEGTYYPTPNNDRTQSFIVPQGVAVYGGFDGTETRLLERQIENHITILSGEIGDAFLRTDNSYHVLTFYDTDSLTILNGFTIEKGYARNDEGDIFRSGGGVLVYTDDDAPICEPTISHCVFRNNYAVKGGGLAALGNDFWRAYPRIAHCEFERNEAQASGGGIYLRWMGYPSDGIALLDSCIFTDNYAGLEGGGFFFEELNYHLLIKNTTFFRDSALLNGGGMGGVQNGGVYSSVKFEGCTFEQCYSDSGAAFSFYVRSPFSQPLPMHLFGEFEIKNCKFIDNFGYQEGGGGIIDQGGGTYDYKIINTLFKGNRVETQDVGAALNITISGNGIARVQVHNSQFINNTHHFFNQGQGALTISGAFTYSNITTRVTNCIFTKNTRAISLRAGAGVARSTIVNCVFTGNGRYPISSSWNFDLDLSDHQMQFYNNIVWEPQSILPIFSTAYGLNGITIHHSLFNTLDCTLDGGDAACGEGILLGLNPLFLDAAAYDFRTAACSPVRNAGDTGGLDSLSLFLDLANQPRIQQNIVDLGAYETPASTIALTAVINNASSATGNDGSIELGNITGGTAPYTYQWSNGDTSAFIDMLLADDYHLIATDAEGCSIDSTFTVSFTNETNTFDANQINWYISNNPASVGSASQVFFKGLSNEEYILEIVNALGQSLHTIPFIVRQSHKKVWIPSLIAPQKGSYYLVLRNKQGQVLGARVWVRV